MVALGDMTVEEAAEKAAGNWQDFSCFWWIRAREIDAPEELGNYLHAQPR